MEHACFIKSTKDDTHGPGYFYIGFFSYNFNGQNQEENATKVSLGKIVNGHIDDDDDWGTFLTCLKEQHDLEYNEDLGVFYRSDNFNLSGPDRLVEGTIALKSIYDEVRSRLWPNPNEELAEDKREILDSLKRVYFANHPDGGYLSQLNYYIRNWNPEKNPARMNLLDEILPGIQNQFNFTVNNISLSDKKYCSSDAIADIRFEEILKTNASVRSLEADRLRKQILNNAENENQIKTFQNGKTTASSENFSSLTKEQPVRAEINFRIPPGKRLDIDNMLKPLFDGIQKPPSGKSRLIVPKIGDNPSKDVHYWTIIDNDQWIDRLIAKKCECEQNENPGTKISIHHLSNEDANFNYPADKSSSITLTTERCNEIALNDIPQGIDTTTKLKLDIQYTIPIQRENNNGHIEGYDLDNLLKITLDAIKTEINVNNFDDSQFYEIDAKKVHRSTNDQKNVSACFNITIQQ